MNVVGTLAIATNANICATANFAKEFYELNRLKNYFGSIKNYEDKRGYWNTKKNLSEKILTTQMMMETSI